MCVYNDLIKSNYVPSDSIIYQINDSILNNNGSAYEGKGKFVNVLYSFF